MAADQLTFSISTPVGAYHPFLRDALSSLAAQDGPLQAAFLDASGDARAGALADEFGALIHYRRCGSDAGQSAAIVEGWRHTDGAILGWLNADDRLFPGALAAVREAFARDAELGVVYGHSTIIDADKRTLGYHWSVEPPGPRLLEGGVISQPSCFFRRDVYERVGGLDESLHYAMDWDLWIRLYKSGAKFGFLDRPLSTVLWGRGTKTSSFDRRRRQELRRIIDAHASAAARGKVLRSFMIHHLIERIPSVRAKAAVTRALVRGRNRINGIGGDGLLSGGATLPLSHYDDAPKTGLRVTADNADAIVAIGANGAPAAIERRTKRTIDVALAAPVAKAEALALGFTVAPGARPYFIHAAWID